MIWRGPMVTQALQQLLNDTNWDDLDYLIVDLPPGTGDIQLTLAQQVPVSGAIIVTTPQDIALLDARKGSRCSRRWKCRCWACREHEHPYLQQVRPRGAHLRRGRRSAHGRADTMWISWALPLDMRIREETDSGKPTVVAEPDSRLPRSIARSPAARREAVAAARRTTRPSSRRSSFRTTDHKCGSRPSRSRQGV